MQPYARGRCRGVVHTQPVARTSLPHLQTRVLRVLRRKQIEGINAEWQANPSDSTC